MKKFTHEDWKRGDNEESWRDYRMFKWWALIISIIVLILFIFPFVSHADVRSHFRPIRLNLPSASTPTSGPSTTTQPSPSPTPSPSNPPPTTPPAGVSVLVSPAGGPSGWCISALHDNPTAPDAIMAEIKAVKAAGFNCVRLAYMNFNNPYSEQGALDAKSLGMYVILGAEWGTFTQSQFSQYESEALTQFKWCQANGIQQCSLGNEQEYRLSGLSIQQWITDAKQMSAVLHQVYLGTISYETSGDFTSNWIASGSLGAIGTLGLNLYCGYACNSGYLQSAINAFGASHVFISETGCDAQAISACRTDAGRAAEIKTDAVLLHKNFPSTPIYFFTWAANGSTGVPSYWAVNNEPTTLSEL